MKKIVLGLMLVALAGCGKLTLENYNELKAGMDYDRVVALLGEPTSCDEILGTKSCTWGEETKNVKVKFIADNVAFFSKEGLK